MSDPAGSTDMTGDSLGPIRAAAKEAVVAGWLRDTVGPELEGKRREKEARLRALAEAAVAGGAGALPPRVEGLLSTIAFGGDNDAIAGAERDLFYALNPDVFELGPAEKVSALEIEARPLFEKIKSAGSHEEVRGELELLLKLGEEANRFGWRPLNLSAEMGTVALMAEHTSEGVSAFDLFEALRRKRPRRSWRTVVRCRSHDLI